MPKYVYHEADGTTIIQDYPRHYTCAKQFEDTTSTAYSECKGHENFFNAIGMSIIGFIPTFFIGLVLLAFIYDWWWRRKR